MELFENINQYDKLNFNITFIFNTYFIFSKLRSFIYYTFEHKKIK